MNACEGCGSWVSLEGMSLADIKAVFADECIDHPTCTYVAAHPLSIVPEV